MNDEHSVLSTVSAQQVALFGGEVGPRRRRVTVVGRSLAVFALTVALSGCSAAILGNAIVFGVTVGIFFGTLGLGRSAASSATRSADESVQR